MPRKPPRVVLSVRSLDHRRGPAKPLLVSAVAAAVAALRRPRVCVEVAYADDATMRRIESGYSRSKTRSPGSRAVTDVLAFPAHQPLPGGCYLLGEVIVNRDAARRNSASEGVTLELLRYVVHGVLHMVGYDDATPELRSAMWRRQEQIVASLCQESNRRTTKRRGYPGAGFAGPSRRRS